MSHNKRTLIAAGIMHVMAGKRYAIPQSSMMKMLWKDPITRKAIPVYVKNYTRAPNGQSLIIDPKTSETRMVPNAQLSQMSAEEEANFDATYRQRKRRHFIGEPGFLGWGDATYRPGPAEMTLPVMNHLDKVGKMLDGWIKASDPTNPNHNDTIPFPEGAWFELERRYQHALKMHGDYSAKHDELNKLRIYLTALDPDEDLDENGLPLHDHVIKWKNEEDKDHWRKWNDPTVITESGKTYREEKELEWMNTKLPGIKERGYDLLAEIDNRVKFWKHEVDKLAEIKKRALASLRKSKMPAKPGTKYKVTDRGPKFSPIRVPGRSQTTVYPDSDDESHDDDDEETVSP